MSSSIFSLIAVRTSASSPRVRTQKFIAVEVNHMIGEVGDPNLGFPDNVRRVFFETGEIHERGIRTAFVSKIFRGAKSDDWSR